MINITYEGLTPFFFQIHERFYFTALDTFNKINKWSWSKYTRITCESSI